MNENPYKEAIRYIENAEEVLKKAGKEGKFYKDEKYVKAACGIAYSGALKALDLLFDIKTLPKRKGRKSIQYYQATLTVIDKKLLDHLNSVYHALHLDGYYDGERSVSIINGGFDHAISIISALKPYSRNGRK
ncbi:MAG: hypothetical protein A2X61_04245 [Ignavibacteria bacterium GWB2_35_12]|nr:MAG: hypothetical protein A2X63_08770 [Ignavibacteria bacterium GWA2_35_8]OGU38891.1 MAG: hypothetical protein A2X61_04245 [Ignavibacteria bacterium GWB2_35_12]OGU85917.1 MAG: hypothetical protein A2220_04950 [Ignavibacteria bacterium RIFOXYA2_FULL_35_10]OGV20345.1 MAG: hypothetical protein A2475_12020 [Ignavibacteria bacterium RIFOXYC2_FULL_35_21]